MILDDRVEAVIPPTVMKRDPKVRGLYVRRTVPKLLMRIRNKYLDEGVDIFNVHVRGDVVEATLRGDLDVSELTEMQKHNRANVIKVRKKKQ